MRGNLPFLLSLPPVFQIPFFSVHESFLVSFFLLSFSSHLLVCVRPHILSSVSPIYPACRQAHFRLTQAYTDENTREISPQDCSYLISVSTHWHLYGLVLTNFWLPSHKLTSIRLRYELLIGWVVTLYYFISEQANLQDLVLKEHPGIIQGPDVSVKWRRYLLSSNIAWQGNLSISPSKLIGSCKKNGLTTWKVQYELRKRLSLVRKKWR